MRRGHILLTSLGLMSLAAAPDAALAAQTASGNGALAFASLLAEHAPSLSASEKKVMADLLEGRLNFTFPHNKKIAVDADSVVCRESNVAIASRDCDLTFGKKMVALHGRKAHELFATLVEIGVPPDGAAGTIYASVAHVVCTIDPNEVKQKSGGGAECQFEPGGH